jgi:hypothetical protein
MIDVRTNTGRLINKTPLISLPSHNIYKKDAAKLMRDVIPLLQVIHPEQSVKFKGDRVTVDGEVVIQYIK